jgi:hypothetical protein
MQRYLLAAIAVVCACGASAPVLAGSFTGTGQFIGTVSAQVTVLLSQFPAGGPGLRAAVARLVETSPSLAADMAFAARDASPGQKDAIGGGLADAASYFAKCGSVCAEAEQLVRLAIFFADAGTRVGFVLASTPTMMEGIPGVGNAGATTGTTPAGCVGAVMSQSRPTC